MLFVILIVGSRTNKKKKFRQETICQSNDDDDNHEVGASGRYDDIKPCSQHLDEAINFNDFSVQRTHPDAFAIFLLEGCLTLPSKTKIRIIHMQLYRLMSIFHNSSFQFSASND